MLQKLNKCLSYSFQDLASFISSGTVQLVRIISIMDPQDFCWHYHCQKYVDVITVKSMLIYHCQMMTYQSKICRHISYKCWYTVKRMPTYHCQKYVAGIIKLLYDWLLDRSIMVDSPIFLRPVLHNWYTKSCGIVHIEDHKKLWVSSITIKVIL